MRRGSRYAPRHLALAVSLAIAASSCASTTQIGLAPAPALATPDPVIEASGSVDGSADSDPAAADDAGPDNSESDNNESAAVPQTTEPPAAEPAPTAVSRPPAPNGRTAPAVATTPGDLAAQIAAAESGLRNPDFSPEQRSALAHGHQVAIRKLGYTPEWDVAVFEALPPEFRDATRLHVAARRSLIDLSSGYSAADFVPAWEIIEPESAESLMAHYREAEAATGIGWEYLAAINLIETGMGRIVGLSSAGAQGPMQFLPTTWDESGIGEGDIYDPNDAINAAARYLVRRGGPGDMAGALWGYNNSDDYVSAVMSYAELLRNDPSAYPLIHGWEIYFFTEAGDIWLPSGFRSVEPVDLVDFLAANPWSAPDEGLR